jgi:hypothetical protein
VDVDQTILNAEAQERALVEALADIRGYLRALREVRKAMTRGHTHPADEPAPVDDDGEG